MLFGGTACEHERSVSFVFQDPLWHWRLAPALSAKPCHPGTSCSGMTHTKQCLWGQWTLEAGRELPPSQSTPQHPPAEGQSRDPHPWVLLLTANISPYPDPSHSCGLITCLVMKAAAILHLWEEGSDYAYPGRQRCGRSSC